MVRTSFARTRARTHTCVNMYRLILLLSLYPCVWNSMIVMIYFTDNQGRKLLFRHALKLFAIDRQDGIKLTEPCHANDVKSTIRTVESV